MNKCKDLLCAQTIVPSDDSQCIIPSRLSLFRSCHGAGHRVIIHSFHRQLIISVRYYMTDDPDCRKLAVQTYLHSLHPNAINEQSWQAATESCHPHTVFCSLKIVLCPHLSHVPVIIRHLCESLLRTYENQAWLKTKSDQNNATVYRNPELMVCTSIETQRDSLQPDLKAISPIESTLIRPSTDWKTCLPAALYGMNEIDHFCSNKQTTPDKGSTHNPRMTATRVWIVWKTSYS